MKDIVIAFIIIVSCIPIGIFLGSIVFILKNSTWRQL